MPEGPQLRVAATPDDSAHACSQYILTALAEVLAARGRATIAISGGKSPKLLFEDMAAARSDWSNIDLFWVDERCVPPTHEDSNFRLANETLLAPARIPSRSVHRIHGEEPPAKAARIYVDDVKTSFNLKDGELPVFDVLHRGMGPDAHTASLFPGSPLVHDRSGIATEVWVEKMKMNRVTLLPGVLFAARRTVLQVAGEEKAEALLHVLQDPEDFLKYPCQIASRDARAIWFLDQAAASKL